MKHKTIKKIGTLLRCMLIVLQAVSIVALYIGFAVFAATKATVSSNGGTLSYITVEQAIKKLQEAAKEQQTVLENCGFNTAINDTDGYTITMHETNAWEALNETNLTAMHNHLISNSILSYIVYDNLVCTTYTDLVVCLDFSDYQIASFGADFLNGLTYAITGSVKAEIFGSTLGASFTESTASGTVTYIDAARGAEITDASVILQLQGIGNVGTNNKSTYTITNSDGTVRKSGEISSYSLHIILPSNYYPTAETDATTDTDTVKTIVFESGSLVSEGVTILGWAISASPPTSVGLDISNLRLRSDNSEIVTVASDAAGKETNHYHYIGASSEQIQYIVQNSYQRVIVNEDGTTFNTGYVEELFYKPYANSHFYRIFAGVEPGGSAGSGTISLYDQPDPTAIENRLSLVQNVVSINTAALSYKHYRRDESNVVQTTAGDITCTLDQNSSVELILSENESIVLTNYHAVTCSHVSNVIGYVDISGDTPIYYILDDNTGYYQKSNRG